MEIDARARTAFLAVLVLFLAATLLMSARLQHWGPGADSSSSSSSASSSETD